MIRAASLSTTGSGSTGSTFLRHGVPERVTGTVVSSSGTTRCSQRAAPATQSACRRILIPRDHPVGTVSSMAPRTDWNPHLRAQFDELYWHDLQAFVNAERSKGPVYPPAPQVFAALHHTPLSQVKVLILGQDPYHGPGQAHGLSFSVPDGVPIPPSLGNIFKELHDDLGIDTPRNGNLERWANAGVLLLNATLTVRGGAAASHQNKGWERFTDEVIRVVNTHADHTVFILWGSAARRKAALIDRSRHTIIESPHPSPLSAHRGFFGSRPFSRANQALIDAGREPVDWSLT